MVSPGSGAAGLLAGGLEARFLSRLSEAWVTVSPGGRLELLDLPEDLGDGVPDPVPEFLVCPAAWLQMAGLDWLHHITESGTAHVVLVGDGMAPLMMRAALAAGAHGLVAPDASSEVLIRVIRSLRDGEVWFSHSQMLAMLESATASAESLHADTWRKLPSLTEREHEVLAKLLAGETNKDISRQLGISEQTVKVHLQHIYSKLGVHRRVELLRAYLSSS